MRVSRVHEEVFGKADLSGVTSPTLVVKWNESRALH